MSVNEPNSLVLSASIKSLEALLPKELLIPVGITKIDTKLQMRVFGCIEKSEDELITPTSSIPPKMVIALLLQRMGAVGMSTEQVLVDVISQALTAKDDVGESLKAVIKNFDETEKRLKDILVKLPKVPRSGKTKYKATSEVVVIS